MLANISERLAREAREGLQAIDVTVELMEQSQTCADLSRELLDILAERRQQSRASWHNAAHSTASVVQIEPEVVCSGDGRLSEPVQRIVGREASLLHPSHEGAVEQPALLGERCELTHQEYESAELLEPVVSIIEKPHLLETSRGTPKRHGPELG